MLFPAAKSRITIQEYLEREASARDKHAYHDGEIRMRAGGTYRHSKVILNAGAAIHARLEGHACQASESSTRVAVQQRSTYVYPDLTVICGEPEFDPLDKRGTTITNPAVVVEVLSDTTDAYDRGAKFDLYRDLPTLREYVIISTSEAAVESFLCQADGEWIFSYAKGLSASIRLRSLGLSVPLSEIYDRISFDAAGNGPEASPSPETSASSRGKMLPHDLHRSRDALQEWKRMVPQVREVGADAAGDLAGVLAQLRRTGDGREAPRG